MLTKDVQQLFPNTISSNTVTIINQEVIQESKADKLLLTYKNHWSKKIFYSKKLDKSFSLQLGHKPFCNLSSQKGLRHWSQSCTGTYSLIRVL